jgi:hypothetical protein
MNSIAKTLIPNKEWLITDGDEKIGSISRSKKGYVFLKNGHSMPLDNLKEINSTFGITIFEESFKKIKENAKRTQEYSIYDFPCSAEPFDPVYSLKKKLPLFAKSHKSKSQYCAGYYIIKFRKGWTKSFCPKLITLERYPYLGPFKTEDAMKTALKQANKS